MVALLRSRVMMASGSRETRRRARVGLRWIRIKDWLPICQELKFNDRTKAINDNDLR